MRYILGHILFFLICFTYVSLSVLWNRRWKLTPALLILTSLLAGPGTLIVEKVKTDGAATLPELLKVLPMALCILFGGIVGWIVGLRFRRFLDAEKALEEEDWGTDDDDWKSDNDPGSRN